MSNLRKLYITPKEAHEISGISEGTLANLRCQRRGPKYYKRPGIGRRSSIYYRLDEFTVWLESQPVLTRDSIKLVM